MDKSSLKQALLEVKEIETFAAKSAKKLMEQEFLPKVEESVRKALLEMEETEMAEQSEISLDAGASVNVTVDSTGKVTIKSGDGTAPIVTDPVAVPSTTSTEVPAINPVDAIVPTEIPAVEELPVEEPADITSGEELDSEIPEEEEELFEIVDDSDETPVVDDDAEGEEPAAETDTDSLEGDGENETGEDEFDLGDEGEDETGEDEFDLGDEGEEEPAAEEGVEDERLSKIESDMEDMKGLLEKILQKVGESEESEGDVEIVGDETDGLEGEDETGEDEFDLGDDEMSEPETEDGGEEGFDLGDEGEEEPAAEDEEEIMFEFEDTLENKDDEDMGEIELHELEQALKEVLGGGDDEHPLTVKDALAEEEINEIEIEGGEDDIEEGMGISLTNQKGQNLKPNTPHKKVRTGLAESDKAQYESKMDGLKKENVSLKSELKEYKDSLVELRKQINEVQTFNAKLAYANKVFTKGGLTNEEKGVIAERFDSCKNADEAKALYNKLIKESTTGSKPNVNKIKLPKAASTNNSSEKGSLYENEETRRMKKLAGIIK